MQHFEDKKRQKLIPLQILLFESIHLKIFHFPLRIVKLQLRNSRRDVREICASHRNGKKVVIKTYDDAVDVTLGVPYSHRLRDLLLRDESLTSSDFQSY